MTTRFLLDYQHKCSIGRYAQSLEILDPHIGDLPSRRVILAKMCQDSVDNVLIFNTRNDVRRQLAWPVKIVDARHNDPDRTTAAAANLKVYVA